MPAEICALHHLDIFKYSRPSTLKLCDCVQVNTAE